MKYKSISIIMVLFSVALSQGVPYLLKKTLVNKHASSIKLKDNLWKENRKLKFKFLSNGNDGTVLTVKNIYQEFFRINLRNRKVVINVNNHDLQITNLHKIHIDDNSWVTVFIKQQRNGIKLVINSYAVMLPIFRDREWLMENSVETYVGIDNYISPNDDPVQISFIGCVEFPLKDKNEYFIEESRAVMNGCINACSLQTCENGGHCINKFEHAYCDCKGTGYEGFACQIASESISLDGSSIMRLSTSRTPHLDWREDITIRFKTSLDGILLATNFAKDLLFIELHEGGVNAMIGLSNEGIFHLNVGKNLNDADWHIIKLSRNFNDIELTVDTNIAAKATIVDDTFDKLNMQGGQEVVYFGGVLDINSFPYSLSKRNFTGCLQHIYFNHHDAVSKIIYGHDRKYSKLGTLKLCGDNFL